MIVLLLIVLIISSCSYSPVIKNEPGVSLELAQYRKGAIDSVVYDLEFMLPLDSDKQYRSNVNILFNLKKGSKSQDLMIDFRTAESCVYDVVVNGVRDEAACLLKNEHLVIPKELLNDGPNEVYVEFNAGKEALNINEEYLYTLLVPDRARELFPCFDQPDIKASYRLSLLLNEQWEAVSNSPVTDLQLTGDGYKRVSFAATEPLSTYLFAFSAGNFFKSKHSAGDSEITIYHRETSAENLAQMDDIADQVFSALECRSR